MVRLLLILTLFCNTAYASGELAFVPSYSLNNEKVGYKFSLNVYEHVTNNWHINPYLQYEKVYNSHNQLYGKLDFNKHLNNFVILGAGTSHLTWGDNKNNKYTNTDVHVNIIIKLW